MTNEMRTFIEGEAYFMTAEEERDARARLLLNYTETKNRLALLKAEAQEIGRTLQVLVNGLTTCPADFVLPPEVERILVDPSKITTLLRDLKKTTAKAVELHQNVKDAGLDG